MRTKHVLVTTALIAAVTLTGCSAGSSDTTGAATSAATSPSQSAGQAFNDADVEFAQQMIPHHRQATSMAQVAAERASSAEVKQLARDIEAAQGPEIETMSGWLDSWGKDVPDPSDSMGGMDHGDMSAEAMPGMMSDAEMDELMGASGTGFDRMFLTMMIKHHEGAIEMAEAEQSEGQFEDAVALARKIEADQQAEITIMRRMLAG
jgi:uncharacterized protein (DUF305 family)